MILILSEDVGQINLKLNKIVDQKSNFIKFLYDDNMDEIEQAIFQTTIFSDESYDVVIINNLSFVSNAKLLDEQKDFLKKLQQSDSKIIITINATKVSNEVKSYFKEIYEFKPLNKYSVKQYVLETLNSFNIRLQNNLVDLLIERLPLDGASITSELNKLSVYKNEEINQTMIEKLIDYDVNTNIFKLIDNYLNNDINQLTKQLNVLENMKIDFFTIFNALVSQLYSLKLYIAFFKTNPSFDNLAKEFGIYKFQVENWAKLFYKFDIEYINRLLNNLLELENDVFNGKKELNRALKLFLIQGVSYENQ